MQILMILNVFLYNQWLRYTSIYFADLRYIFGILCSDYLELFLDFYW